MPFIHRFAKTRILRTVVHGLCAVALGFFTFVEVSGAQGLSLPAPWISTSAEIDHIVKASATSPEYGVMPDELAELTARKPVLTAMNELAVEVLRLFPPSEYDYVSLGRSGIGVALAIENILASQKTTATVTELPMSGLREVVFRAEWYETSLRQHLERYFRPSEGNPLAGAKKVLVLDFVQRGGSMSHFVRILQLAKEKRWITRDVHLLGFLNPTLNEKGVWFSVQAESEGRFPESNWHTMKIPQSLYYFFYYSAWKSYAEFRGWVFRDRGYEQRMLSYDAGVRKGRVAVRPEEPAYDPPFHQEKQLLLRLVGVDLTRRQDYQRQLREVLPAGAARAAMAKACKTVHHGP